jgi:hypothetical protein
MRGSEEVMDSRERGRDNFILKVEVQVSKPKTIYLKMK